MNLSPLRSKFERRVNQPPPRQSPKSPTTPASDRSGGVGFNDQVPPDLPVQAPRVLVSRDTPSRRSDRSAGSSRPGTRERALTPAQVQKQAFRMRFNVASLSPAHFESSVTRYSPPDDLLGFLPSILASRPMTRNEVPLPSRPHTVVSRLDEDADPFPAAASVVAAPKQPGDGRSALSMFLFSQHGPSGRSASITSPTATAAVERALQSLPGLKKSPETEFPTLTRVDVLRRRRRPFNQGLDANDCERCATPFGLQIMAHRISTTDPGPRSRSSLM